MSETPSRDLATWLSDLPLDRPVGTVMLLLSLMVFGAVAVTRLPLGFVPVLDEPQVDVEAPFPGCHPLEGLRDVGRPLEEELATIPGVERLSTHARAGQVTVEVSFDWAADVDLKKLEVRDAVTRARDRLPAGVGFIRVEGDTGGIAGGSILQGRIAAARDLSGQWELLERRLKRPLERVRGVARVHLYGVEAPQVRIDLDLPSLERHGVEAGRVLAEVEAGNVDLDLGGVEDGVLRHDVRLAGRFVDVEALRGLALAPGLRLSDVAHVEARPPRLTYGRHLDRKYAVGIDVFKQPTANTVETVDRLRARLAEVERDPDLAGVKLLVWQDAGEEIRRSIGALRDAGLQGAALAIVVLLVFLRRPGTTAVVALSIPFSLVVTCGAMLLLGSELNVITMLGLMLGVGMLVDNAVVVAESIVRLQEEGLSPRDAARRGTREVLLAVVGSTATTVVVWAWLLVAPRSPLVHYMGGVGLTISLSATASLLISVTLIPLAAARMKPPRGPARAGDEPGDPAMARLVRGYRRLLAWTLRHRLSALVLLVLVAGSAAWPALRLETSSEPRMRQRAATIHYEVLDPSTREVLEGHVEEVEAWLETRREELGVESTYSWFSEDEGCLTFVYLPQAEATKEKIAALRDTLRAGLPTIPGVVLKIGERMWSGPPRGGDQRRVSVALHGEDPEWVQVLARRIEDRLRGLPGAVDVRGPSDVGQKELRVLVDPERCHALGVLPATVGEVVRFALRGRPLRRFRGPDGELELRSGIDEKAGEGVASLERLPIPLPSRGASLARDGGPTTTPLGSLARFEVVRTPESIEREDRRTSAYVVAELDDATTTEAAQEAVKARLADLALPEGYAWDFGAWGRDRDETLAEMGRGLGLSLLVVVLLMAALFESWSQPLAIIITLPLAFTGAFWSLWALSFELDVVAFIGVILLVGIVVNNGIVLVDRVNSLREAGLPREEALLVGCGQRLRPVVMTALTTLVGLVPLALSGSTIAGAYIDSMAVAVLGGLLTSTVFTLLALPVWYTFVEDVASVLLRAVPRLTTRPAPSR